MYMPGDPIDLARLTKHGSFDMPPLEPWYLSSPRCAGLKWNLAPSPSLSCFPPDAESSATWTDGQMVCLLLWDSYVVATCGQMVYEIQRSSWRGPEYIWNRHKAFDARLICLTVVALL